jgi:acetyl esterase/lipase
MIGGDSAGGNLATAVLLHTTHPSDLAPPLLSISETNKVKALLLISPWVSFDTSLSSFERNRNRDYLKAETEKRWSDMYVNDQLPSPYNEPGLASETQWKGLPVQDILVTAGSYEVLIDGIHKWVKELKVRDPRRGDQIGKLTEYRSTIRM